MVLSWLDFYTSGELRPGVHFPLSESVYEIEPNLGRPVIGDVQFRKASYGSNRANISMMTYFCVVLLHRIKCNTNLYFKIRTV